VEFKILKHGRNNEIRSSLKRVLIVAINARPIASSVRSLGWNAGIVDFFGDPEIKQLGSWVFSVIHQETGGVLRRKIIKSREGF